MRETDTTGKKKIMLISPMLHQGGFERICVLTARLLQEKFDVVIVVFSLDDLAFDISGLTVIDLKVKAKDGKLNKVVNLLKRCVKLSRLQKKLETDISYSFGMTANIANALSFGAKKKLSACHSFEEIKNSRYMKLISKCTDGVLCCSKKMADLVEKTYGFTNVNPLWNPCNIGQIVKLSSEPADEDLAFFRSEDNVLVSMGREDDVKGFWHLIKIFRRVNEKKKDTRLAIIGDGAFTEYKQLVKDLNLEDKVCFTGLKKNPFPYLKESDLYLLTSLSEGLPNALVEAMTFGLPIVSANCMSGPAEILHENWREAESANGIFFGDYGILAPILSPKKQLSFSWEEGSDEKKIQLEEAEEIFAKLVVEVLENKELLEKYQESAVQRAKDFSKEDYIDGLLLCMEKL